MTGARKASYLSVVIPIYNEEVTIERLHERLSRVLEPLGKAYEIIYIDDGSTDGTRAILQRLHAKDPNVKVIVFNRNYGQHAAVVAGFERAGGEIIVTLDGDLQNPPEEIPKLLEKIQEGYDVVGGWREGRQDSLVRRLPSFLINPGTSLIVGGKLKDYGCMLRAYRRGVVERICPCPEISSFIPVFANFFAP